MRHKSQETVLFLFIEKNYAEYGILLSHLLYSLKSLSFLLYVSVHCWPFLADLSVPTGMKKGWGKVNCGGHMSLWMSSLPFLLCPFLHQWPRVVRWFLCFYKTSGKIWSNWNSYRSSNFHLEDGSIIDFTERITSHLQTKIHSKCL